MPTPVLRGSYVVVDHARRGALGLDGFYKLVAPRYRHRRIALFASELRTLHHLLVQKSRSGNGAISPGTLILLTVHRGGTPNGTPALLGPVAGSAILLSPGGLLCTDLDPTDPGLASAVAAYLYDRLAVDRVSASARTRAPESSILDQRMLMGLLPAMSGETGATSVMAAAWATRTGLSSRVMSAQQVLELTPERAIHPPKPRPAVEGHAELSGSASSTDDALRALVQNYADQGPSFRSVTDLPQLSGVLPVDSVTVQAVLNRLAGDSKTIPVGDVFARSSRDLGDRTVLWVTDTHDVVKYPVAMAHLTHPVESVIRIGPVHVTAGMALESVAAAQEANIPMAATHPALRGREKDYARLMLDGPGSRTPKVSGSSGEEGLRGAYRAAVVGEAARLALRAGAGHVVIHTRLDDPHETETYQRSGFAPVGSLVRLSFSPAGTIPLR